MKKFYSYGFSHFVWSPVYEGEDDKGKQGDDKNDGKPLTQEQVNAIVAAERKKHEAHVNKLSTELEALKSRSNLTAQEREEMESRLLALKTESMSKEEKAKLALQTEQKKWEAENKTLKEAHEKANSKYREYRIQNDLVAAAAGAKAFNPRTVVALLRSDTDLVEVLGEDGKPTGDDAVKVKYKTKGADGKPVILELEPAEAIKRLSEDEEHAFMFQSSGSGGGGNNNRGNTGKVSGEDLVANWDTFKKNRDAINSGQVR